MNPVEEETLSKIEVLSDLEPLVVELMASHEAKRVLWFPAELLEAPPGEPALGGQIVFAIYDAVRRGQLDPELSALFMAWPKPPEDLVASLAQLWEAPRESAKRLAEHCLGVSLTPPLAPPTQATLEALAKG